MARVYRALDERLEREIALKVMHGHLADNDVFRSRFQREARSAARLSHPAVVGVYDQGVDGDAVYLAMELVEGQTVREYLNAKRVLTVDEAVAIIEPVLDALGAAHRAGIIHRDVKPENVLMGLNGTVKVADFGLARAVTDATATSTNTVMGTVAYLSPELLSRGVADARSDIYAVGVLLHEMLTGTQPHVGETPIQVAYQHVHEDLPAARTKAPWIAPQMDAFIAELAARDPDDRPVDGDAALQRLLGVYQEIPIEQRSYRPSDAEQQSALVAGTPATGDTINTEEDGAAGEHDDSDEHVDSDAHGSSDATSDFDATDAIVGAGGQSGATSSEAVALASTQTSRFPAPAPPPPADGSATSPAQAASVDSDSPATQVAPADAGSLKSQDAPRAAGKPRAGSKKLRKSARRQREGADGQRRNKKRSLLWLWITLPILLLLGGGTWWYFFHGPGSFTTVPNVVSAPAKSATTVLAEHNLQSAQSEAVDDEVPAGYVISTDPGPDSNVKKDTTVEMVVSKGPEHFEIPDVIDVPLDEAIEQLEANDLKFEVAEDEPWSEKIAEGNVVSIEPEVGTEVTRRDEIVLEVSAGREPIDVPLTVNMSQKDAVAALEDVDLKAEIKEEYSDTLAAGHVLSQEPNSGTLYRGDTVTVVVSRGPERIEVPNVLGKHVDEAKKELEDLGFEVKTRQMNDWWVWGERVSEQKPGAGKKLKKGEEVTLTLS